jgi:hypothetical protein
MLHLAIRVLIAVLASGAVSLILGLFNDRIFVPASAKSSRKWLREPEPGGILWRPVDLKAERRTQ